MNKILLSVLVILSIAFAMVNAIKLDSTPIIHDPTVDQVVEELGLFSEKDSEINIPAISMTDLPMFSYLENTNTVVADSQLHAEIEAEVKHAGISSAPLSFVEVDSSVDMEAEAEFEAGNPGTPASLDNGNLPSKPEVIKDDCTAFPNATLSAEDKANILVLPKSTVESTISPKPYVNLTLAQEPKPLKFPKGADIIPKMIPPNGPALKVTPLPSRYKYSPGDASSTIEFKLFIDKNIYWKDPANFRVDLLHQIASTLSVPSRRLQILNIDPHTLITTVKIKQAGREDFRNNIAVSDVLHAEGLALLFKNVHARRAFNTSLSLLKNIDPSYVVKYNVTEIQLPTLTGLSLQFKIAADVAKLASNLRSYVDSLIKEIVRVTGVHDTQIVFKSITPFMGSSLKSILVSFKFTSRPDTLSDAEVNPMTALMRFKRAMENKKSIMYKLPILKTIDDTFPLQRDLNTEPLVPYKSWNEDPAQYKFPTYQNSIPDTKPVIIPTLLVGRAINETTAVPDKIALTI